MKEQYKTLDETLQILCQKAKESSIFIEEILKILSGRGRSLILIFLSLPFCQPIQIPGLSTPFGLIIAFLGLRMSFGKSFLLPKFLLKKRIASEKIQKISQISLKVLNKLHFLLRRRLDWMFAFQAMHIANGLVVCLLGIFLALPLPIPFTNLIAAWAIFLIGLGILEDDGLFILAGYAIFILVVAIFIYLILLTYRLI